MKREADRRSGIMLLPGRVAIALTGITLVAPLVAQVESAAPLPYVVSVKPGNASDPGGFWITPGRFLARNVTARFLVAIAYGVQNFQVSGGPGWVDNDHFDVEARLDDAMARQGQEGPMMKSLLADRFHLVLHKETRESSVYALNPGGNGLKIRPSSDQTPGPGMSPLGSMKVGAGSLVGTGVPLELFASLLGTRLGRTVIDQTNLAGRYDIDLAWTPDVGEIPSASADILPQSDSSGPSIFTAIQQQLGLKLQSTRRPAAFLVIDRMEKPSGN
jgi:uncharacterized protein (TIGR03435 family)